MSDKQQYDFSDIAPVDDAHFHENMAIMVKDPGLEHAVKWVMHDVNYPEFVEQLLGIKDKYTFQHKVMWPFMEMLAKKTTNGVTISGVEKISADNAYTYITNHRDIVLDASFLNICLFRNNLPSAEVAIGSNLLIYDWIEKLVKLNKCFIVKRGLRRLEALDAACELSAYIHDAVCRRKESVWIAQREGRAKDSSDHTQESLIKMMSLEGGDSTKENLAKLNLTPVAITYEYDPNDYLKAREFLLRHRDPEFKKSQRDDLFSMETGILQFKGRVHYSIGDNLNERIMGLSDDMDRGEMLEAVCQMIDHAIHSGYKIYTINYIAYDELLGDGRYEPLYTPEEKAAFMEYIDKQLDKVEVDNVTPEEREYMRKMMFTMYANPLRNKLAALEQKA